MVFYLPQTRFDTPTESDSESFSCLYVGGLSKELCEAVKQLAGAQEVVEGALALLECSLLHE